MKLTPSPAGWFWTLYLLASAAVVAWAFTRWGSPWI